MLLSIQKALWTLLSMLLMQLVQIELAFMCSKFIIYLFSVSQHLCVGLWLALYSSVVTSSHKGSVNTQRQNDYVFCSCKKHKINKLDYIYEKIVFKITIKMFKVNFRSLKKCSSLLPPLYLCHFFCKDEFLFKNLEDFFFFPF